MTKGIDAYLAKRDFDTTPEPRGNLLTSIRRCDHLRFVIQKHDATRLHYDLRLELDGVFKSWAVTRGPSLDPAERRLAVEVEDHPLEYGDFEGTIPASEYGGGTVMIWDRGYWAPATDKPPGLSLRDGELKLILAGGKLMGSWVLVRLKGKPREKKVNWLLIKHRDEWATPGRDTVLSKDRSIASGRSMTAIAQGRGKPPEPFMTDKPIGGAAAVWDTTASARSRRRRADERALTPPPAVAAMPRLTSPARVLWPDVGITKRDLAKYLIDVAPWMMPHIYGRPCSLLRAPEGIAGETFFQRHVMAGQPGRATEVKIDGDHQAYLQIDDAQTLVDMAQISSIELHPWNCAPFQPLVPGRLVFDLDPATDVAFDVVIDAARELRHRLDAVGLVGFCKTTGGKGLHVVTPLTPDDSTSWEQAKLFAQTVCARMAADSPKRFLIKMTKKIRGGRIFLDYLRNDLTSTAVAPLSPRARPGATVSMPLTWQQVRKGLDPTRFTIASAPALLRKSTAWNDYDAGARPLKEAIARLVGAPG